VNVSAVVPAYNEALNIRAMLTSLLAQRLTRGRIVEVVVVASGCTDGTLSEVESIKRDDARVRLIVQHAREGKSAALNAYLDHARPVVDVVVIASADLRLEPGCVDLLLEALDRDPNVGMCGSRPVPTNLRGTLMGDVVNFLWTLHHEVSLEAPKLGEAVAIRASLLSSIPVDSAVDEASLEAKIVDDGFTLRYVPSAVVLNRGPESLCEFVAQRRRIAAGHFWLRDRTGYAVATLDVRRIVRLAVRHALRADLRTDVSYLAAAALEAVSRGLGYLDFCCGRSHAIWKMIPSTRAVSRPHVTAD
jgi:poly-beta-1,6-N-acetyl-D-glucosamine synthase